MIVVKSNVEIKDPIRYKCEAGHQFYDIPTIHIENNKEPYIERIDFQCTVWLEEKKERCWATARPVDKQELDEWCIKALNRINRKRG